jgi:hypothetical protein
VDIFFKSAGEELIKYGSLEVHSAKFYLYTALGYRQSKPIF